MQSFAKTLAGFFIELDQGVGRVIMYRFEIFGLEHILSNTVVLVQLTGDIPHHVFDKFWIIIGTLGHVFFIRALQQSVEFTRGLSFDDIDELFNPDETTGFGVDGYV